MRRFKSNQYTSIRLSLNCTVNTWPLTYNQPRIYNFVQGFRRPRAASSSPAPSARAAAASSSPGAHAALLAGARTASSSFSLVLVRAAAASSPATGTRAAASSSSPAPGARVASSPSSPAPVSPRRPPHRRRRQPQKPLQENISGSYGSDGSLHIRSRSFRRPW